MPPLKNPRHEQFSQFVAGGKTPTESYIAVGFSVNGAAASANKLLKVTKVRARVLDLQAAMEQSTVMKAVVDKGWIISTLRLNVERAMQEVEVLDNKGKPTGEFRYDGSVANRALELLGKELGMFRDVHELHHFGPVSEIIKRRQAARRQHTPGEVET